MPAGKYRSRTFRRVHTRLPSSKSKLVYKRRRPSKIYCYNCNQELHGVATAIVSRLKNMTKSSKRPSRPYAGSLCSSCSREKIKEMFRI